MTPGICYFICTEPRTGGHFLGECLRNTGLAGYAGECFWKGNEQANFDAWGIDTYQEYIRKAFEMNTSDNGVFGVKVGMGEENWGHFVNRLRSIQPRGKEAIGEPELMAGTFPNLRYIHLTRRNKVRQAVSWWKALQTGIWNWKQYTTQEPGQAAFKFTAIDHLIQELVMRETAWQEYFSKCGVTPFSVTYEDFARNDEKITKEILKFLGLMPSDRLDFKERRQKRIADEINEQWVQRYRQEKQANWQYKGW